MSELHLTAEDLLSGATVTYDVVVPPEVLRPAANGHVADAPAPEMLVRISPLTIGAFQLILKASRNETALIPLLMIKESLIQPALTLDQIKQLHLGLVDFLVEQIRTISGLATTTEKKSHLTA